MGPDLYLWTLIPRPKTKESHQRENLGISRLCCCVHTKIWRSQGHLKGYSVLTVRRSYFIRVSEIIRWAQLPGDLICFFRAPPRIVWNPLRDISVSSTASRSREPVSRLFQSPALLSDAVRRLGLAATDRSVLAVDWKKVDDGPDNILRIMTNLLTFSQQKYRRESESKPLGEIPASYSLIPPRRNTVYIMRGVDVARADKKVAREYVFESETLSTLCGENARIANANRRYDHARIFMMLQSLFPSSAKGDAIDASLSAASSGFGLLAHQIVTRL